MDSPSEADLFSVQRNTAKSKVAKILINIIKIHIFCSPFNFGLNNFNLTISLGEHPTGFWDAYSKSYQLSIIADSPEVDVVYANKDVLSLLPNQVSELLLLELASRDDFDQVDVQKENKKKIIWGKLTQDIMKDHLKPIIFAREQNLFKSAHHLS